MLVDNLNNDIPDINDFTAKTLLKKIDQDLTAKVTRIQTIQRRRIAEKAVKEKKRSKTSSSNKNTSGTKKDNC